MSATHSINSISNLKMTAESTRGLYRYSYVSLRESQEAEPLLDFLVKNMETLKTN